MDGPSQTGDYARIARAIRYLADNREHQPSLADLARDQGLSPHHLHRVFGRWAGVSPKQFLGILTLATAKQALDASASVLDAALHAGLSGPGRLHDHFVTLEAVTPGEYKAMGSGLEIRFGLHDSPFGTVLLAITSRGVCHLAFVADGGAGAAMAELERNWPGARLIGDAAATAPAAEAAFAGASPGGGAPIRLWCRGTNYQVRVWRALLAIPEGRTTSYGRLACALGQPGAARAVGGAVGANSIGWLIPCHRVIRAAGPITDDYRWGGVLKQAMLAREAAAQLSPSTSTME